MFLSSLENVYFYFMHMSDPSTYMYVYKYTVFRSKTGVRSHGTIVSLFVSQDVCAGN